MEKKRKNLIRNNFSGNLSNKTNSEENEKSTIIIDINRKGISY